MSAVRICEASWQARLHASPERHPTLRVFGCIVSRIRTQTKKLLNREITSLALRNHGTGFKVCGAIILEPADDAAVVPPLGASCTDCGASVQLAWAGFRNKRLEPCRQEPSLDVREVPQEPALTVTELGEIDGTKSGVAVARPVSATLCVSDLTLSVNLRIPFCVPLVVGANVTCIEQLCLMARLFGHVLV